MAPARLSLRCCPCDAGEEGATAARRERLCSCGIEMTGSTLSGLSWAELSAVAAAKAADDPLNRRPLVVQPVFTYPVPVRQHQNSWRMWGGLQSQADIDEEANRIRGELDRLKADADFPLQFLPLAMGRRADALQPKVDAAADVLLVYAAGDGDGDLMAAMNPLSALGKDMILFIRHKSGPVYYWYEGMMARFLHQHTDGLACKGADYGDVVTDRLDEVLWRLRALIGRKNTRHTKMVAIGGAGGWGPSGVKAPDLATEKWHIDVHTVLYDELSRLVKDATADAAAMKTVRGEVDAYLRDPGVKLEVPREPVENAFALMHVFRALMNYTNSRSMTISGCMQTVMPIARTSACLALSALNDSGYLAFCESDFVAIPAGLLLSNIAGRPNFLNDPTFPHKGLITLAHCTAPRRMDGKTLEPARLLTHFESDYGAAPKVEFRKGQRVTSIIPDFAQTRWSGVVGEIVESPSLDICRSQMDVAYSISDARLGEAMSGFHWETVYGDYSREVGYALKRTPIGWQSLA